MDNVPSPELTAQWHRRFAASCNNRAWALSWQETRSDQDNREMLDAAHAASYHWDKVGTALNHARADVTLAHVHALLGHGELALAYARACLAFFEAGNGEDWDLAFAHMEMALAAVVLGDRDLYDRHYALATQLGQAVADIEDREVFLEELARVPVLH
ncbi:MAG: hypothetical protein KDI55_13665 [Anaerolineae bacterium]|nr:hypothetical protein [Anaerolineae bacterium]